MNWTEEKIEIVVSYLLRGGVLTSSAIICVGLVLTWLHPAPLSDLSHLHAARPAIPGWNGSFVLWVGLWALAATPVARVAFTLIAFGIQGDLLYVWVTTVVLGVLAFSWLRGR